ncbi:hypothetical protein ACYCI3_28675 [Escherichia coli]|uniref:hypothetical protein n=1 Tax=Enterobacteriaceae TaxID=543 RepID=UPI002290BD45|nr:hypothetical protein [Salmonella enterica subsp. enterica serovar Muenchen]MEC5669504.1 hypothetical protein [Escherichia coli]HCU2346398.1 hypothetical protein [Citrobacter freundii]MEC5710774.1 hypothetical protein [Escherichia coli]HCX4269409.1 hypothetical protein [Escherichia coli]
MKSQTLIESLAATVLEDIHELVGKLSEIELKVNDTSKQTQASSAKFSIDAFSITKRLEDASREISVALKDKNGIEMDALLSIRFHLIKQSKLIKILLVLSSLLVVAVLLLSGAMIHLIF